MSLTCREKRCEDCTCLISKNGVMCCDELWGRPCDDIGADECPEDITLEEIEVTAEKVKNVKIDHGVGGNKEKTERKPRTIKISNEKVHIFEEIVDFLSKDYDISIITDNKLLEIHLNGKTFKLNLSENRQKK